MPWMLAEMSEGEADIHLEPVFVRSKRTLRLVLAGDRVAVVV